jgi:hypothetical protein
MRRLALVVLLLTLPRAAFAQETSPPVAQPRGALTGFGLALLAAGLGMGGLGLAGAANASEAGQSLSMFSVPLMAEESPAYRAQDERRQASVALAAVGFIVGGLMLAGGVTCLVLDGRPVAVSFAPTRDGAAFSLALRW